MVVGTSAFISRSFLLVLLVCDCFLMRGADSVDSKDKEFAMDDAVNFMKQFGYLQGKELLDRSGPQALYDESMSIALKNVQGFGGLPQTGILDEATIKLMKSDRCGVPDILPSNRRKRDTPWTTVWNKGRLTYFVGDTYKIPQNLARIELRDAFNLWAEHSKLEFDEVTNSHEADIIILFRSREHGDGSPFDGEGRVLAHAFAPNDFHGMSGDIHFDNDEAWGINIKDHGTTDFFSVAIHEIGHSLGFSHTDNSDSVMYASYKLYDKSSFKFTYDIRKALHEMYILNPKIKRGNSHHYVPTETTRRPYYRPQATTTTTTTTRRPYYRPTETTTTRRPYYRPTETTTTRRPYYRPQETTTRLTTTTTIATTKTTTEPQQTNNSHLKPVIPSSTEYILSFEGDYESVVDHKRQDPTHDIPRKVNPILICKKEVPDTPPDFCEGNFDAVANLRRELYIFKKGYVNRLSERGHGIGGPRKYQHTWFTNKSAEMLNCMDAIYERPSDQNFIIFTGSIYWVFNDLMNMLENGPQPIQNYGIPDYVTRIDTVMVLNKKTYLFREGLYWRYDDFKKKLDDGYPLSTKFFVGFPPNIDAAMTWTDGNTYFFKGNEFWRFNTTWKRLENVHNYSASEYWLNCRK